MPFLRNFMEWNNGTEVPAQYYFWSGVSTLASLVNGQVWSHMGRYQVFPNLYIVLLGPPGNGKTSAMRRAEKIVRNFDDIALSAQSETAEGMVRYMRDKCVKTFDIAGKPTPYTPVTCFLSELSNFFGRDPGGMIDLLTGVWDCGGEQFHRRTKGQGEDVIPRPNLNVLACTTQEWITNYLKSDIIGGGFSRRVVFVNEMMTNDDIRVSWPEDTPERMTAMMNCVSYGKVLRGVTGEMRYGDGARAWWDRWYTTRVISREPDVRGYHKSKPTILLKVAMLVALSERPELVIRIQDFETALALLDSTETHLLKVFQGIGRNELNAVAMKVLEYLAAAPELEIDDTSTGVIRKVRVRLLPEKELQARMYRDAPGRDLTDIFNHLTAADKISRVPLKDDKNITRVFIVLKP